MADTKLSDELDRFTRDVREVELPMVPLVKLFNTPDIDVDTTEEALEKLRSFKQGIRNSLIAINRRIEDLLTGEP